MPRAKSNPLEITDQNGTVRHFDSAAHAARFYGHRRNDFYPKGWHRLKGLKVRYVKSVTASLRPSDVKEASTPKQDKASRERRREVFMEAISTREGQVDLVARGLQCQKQSEVWKLPVRVRPKDESEWSYYNSLAHFVVDVDMPEKQITTLPAHMRNTSHHSYYGWIIEVR